MGMPRGTTFPHPARYPLLGGKRFTPVVARGHAYGCRGSPHNVNRLFPLSTRPAHFLKLVREALSFAHVLMLLLRYS